MNKPNDTDLREALRRREAKRKPVVVPDDFAERVMQRVDTATGQPAQPRHRRWPWVAGPVLAAAASVVIAVLLVKPHEAQLDTSPYRNVAAITPTSSAAVASSGQTASMKKVRKPQSGSPKATNRQSLGHKLAVRRPQSETEPVDSLYNYLSAVEQKLTEIQDSCYEARVERLIRDDARLQQLVIKFVLNGILSDTLRTTAQI